MATSTKRIFKCDRGGWDTGGGGSMGSVDPLDLRTLCFSSLVDAHITSLVLFSRFKGSIFMKVVLQQSPVHLVTISWSPRARRGSWPSGTSGNKDRYSTSCAIRIPDKSNVSDHQIQIFWHRSRPWACTGIFFRGQTFSGLPKGYNPKSTQTLKGPKKSKF